MKRSPHVIHALFAAAFGAMAAEARQLGMSTRQFVKFSGRARGGKTLRRATPGAFGKCRFQPQLTQLTNEKFMSSAQKKAHREGVEIWV